MSDYCASAFVVASLSWVIALSSQNLVVEGRQWVPSISTTPQCCLSIILLPVADHVGLCPIMQFAVLQISSKLTLSWPEMIQRSSKLARKVVGFDIKDWLTTEGRPSVICAARIFTAGVHSQAAWCHFEVGVLKGWD